MYKGGVQGDEVIWEGVMGLSEVRLWRHIGYIAICSSDDV